MDFGSFEALGPQEDVNARLGGGAVFFPAAAVLENWDDRGAATLQNCRGAAAGSRLVKLSVSDYDLAYIWGQIVELQRIAQLCSYDQDADLQR